MEHDLPAQLPPDIPIPPFVKIYGFVQSASLENVVAYVRSYLPDGPRGSFEYRQGTVIGHTFPPQAGMESDVCVDGYFRGLDDSGVYHDARWFTLLTILRMTRVLEDTVQLVVTWRDFDAIHDFVVEMLRVFSRAWGEKLRLYFDPSRNEVSREGLTLLGGKLRAAGVPIEAGDSSVELMAEPEQAGARRVGESEQAKLPAACVRWRKSVKDYLEGLPADEDSTLEGLANKMALGNDTIRQRSSDHKDSCFDWLTVKRTRQVPT